MKICGHRGAMSEAPENTLLGVHQAIKAGVHAIEIDVQKTLDNKLIVIHDPTLDRTTNGQGLVSKTNYEDIKKLDAGQGEVVPLLEDVLKLCIEKNIYLFIESKTALIEQDIANLISKYNAFNKCAVICFYHQFLKNIKAINPKIITGCLISCAPIDPISIVKNALADFISISIKVINPEFVKSCKDAGLEISVWNANTKLEFEKMKQLGVDFILTDKPSLIVPLLEKK